MIGVGIEMHVDLREGNLNAFLAEGVQTLLVQIATERDKIRGLAVRAYGEFDRRILHGGDAGENNESIDRRSLCQMRLHRGRMVLRGHSYTATKKEKHLYRLHKGNYVCFVRAFFYGQADTEVWKMHRHISSRLQQR